MSRYEDNMSVIQERNPVLYDALVTITDMPEDVSAEDALDGERIMILQQDRGSIALESIYDPTHAAERYAEQFKVLPEAITLLLFGFGDGKALRKILQKEYLIHDCMVYEPSIALFCKALQEYDLRDVLSSPKLTIYVRGINDQSMENVFDSRISHTGWKQCYIASLPIYSEVYSLEFEECSMWYKKILNSKKGELCAAIEFAEKGLENEIKSQRWLMESWSADSLIGKFPRDIPCIVVAAGPSLEGNVEELHKAKGRACIIAVDSAIPCLMKHDIIPDFLCTIDAKKPTTYFADERLKGLPIFLSTNSNYELFEKLEDFDPIYFSTISPYYDQLVRNQGHEIWGSNGGGSVATMSFWLAAQLGFRTIILIGQDLAYTDMNSHAGTGQVTKEELELYSLFFVEGYNGGEVLTRGDFKLYIDWYERTIPELNQEHTIINSTEGGAKLHGAIQMPLKEAIEQYCTSQVDCRSIYQQQPRIWPTIDDKREYYQTLCRSLEDLRRLQRDAQNGCRVCDQALDMLRRPSYSERQFMKLEDQINHKLSIISDSPIYHMLLNRIVENNVEFYESANKVIPDLDERRRYLYQSIYDHMHSLITATEECINLWQESLSDIEEIYHF